MSLDALNFDEPKKLREAMLGGVTLLPRGWSAFCHIDFGFRDLKFLVVYPEAP